MTADDARTFPQVAARHGGVCRYCGTADGAPAHVYGERKCCPDCDHRPDLSALLDRLEAARQAATVRFPWRQDSGYGEDVITADGEQFGVTGEPADAALIVAAVNALPTLVAELRAHQAAVQAVRELADELAREGWISARRLHAAVAALDPKGQTDE